MSRRKGRDGSRRSDKVTKDDEVETLLQAAEDELLLNLSIDSHVAARGSSSSSLYSLDPDLHRRFQALRSHPKPLPPRHHPENPSGSADAVGRAEADEGDLFARFAALKENNNNNIKKKELLLDERVVINSSSWGIIGKSDDESDDEVAKVMRWAVDAARLDPDDDDDNDEVEVSSCSTSDDDEEEDYKRGKESKKTKKNMFIDPLVDKSHV